MRDQDVERRGQEPALARRSVDVVNGGRDDFVSPPASAGSENNGRSSGEMPSLRILAGLMTVALQGMEDGATNAGLPPGIARAFTRQTVLSTALLLEKTGGSPADLKDQVASPAGTTIAGLAVLEDHAVRGAFLRAAESALKHGAQG